jgi:hypothetical protein
MGLNVDPHSPAPQLEASEDAASVSLDTVAPYTSGKCAATSPVVNPLAVNDNTISSMPVRRR